MKARINAQVCVIEVHRHDCGAAALMSWQIGEQKATVIAFAREGSTVALQLSTTEPGDLVRVIGVGEQISKPGHLLGEMVRIEVERLDMVRREPLLWRRVKDSEGSKE